ncbi:DUF1788 domain-containing protein [Candidatus Poribacteria bacterium]|nr:DUF1788 domain-containing protein [Candidatus Poribacteria bacterium]
MNKTLDERLNEILPTITSSNFLQKKGLGNEIPFHIFDYPPEDELRVREHLHFLIDRLEKQYPHIKVIHVELFRVMIQYLEDLNLLEKAFEMEAQKGSEALWKALSASVKPERFVKTILARQFDFSQCHLILMNGVGNVWPWIRAHSLLNNLQQLTGDVPMVLFYPGGYDGQSLRLFGRLGGDNYYRAFRLVK